MPLTCLSALSTIAHFLSTILMMHRGLMIGLGLLLSSAPMMAHAAFPEDFRIKTTAPVAAPAQPAGDEKPVDLPPAPVMHTDFTQSQVLTRAEFTALVVEKLYTQNELDRCFWSIASNRPPHFTLVFTDVHVND